MSETPWTPPPDCNHCNGGAVLACCHSYKFGRRKIWTGWLACGCPAGLRLSSGRHVPFAQFEDHLRTMAPSLTPEQFENDTETSADGLRRWYSGKPVTGWVYYRVTTADQPRLELWEEIGRPEAEAFRAKPSDSRGGLPRMDRSAYDGGRHHAGGAR